MCSNQAIRVPRQKLEMSPHTQRASQVEMALLITSLVAFEVGVLTSPGCLMRLPPTVTQLRSISAFCGDSSIDTDVATCDVFAAIFWHLIMANEKDGVDTGNATSHALR
jgi:hypothetical protein